MKETVNFINHSGFWGDSHFALPHIFKSNEEFDYLVGDYLSEVTMGLLAKMKKYHQPGYIGDYFHQVEPFLSLINDRKIKCISNAGGLNPKGLADLFQNKINELGLSLKVASVSGDELSSEQLGRHAYLGASAIVKALKEEADIIITGRVVDSALVLAPLIYEFNWRDDQYDLLAQGALAGHLIECGTQLNGGNATEYRSYNLENTSYPKAEVYNTGEIYLSSIKGMSGGPTFSTVCEQLIYEIGDPSAYLLPDVICDFTDVRVEEEGDHIKVSGAKGKAPLKNLKTLEAVESGYRLITHFVMVGEDSREKATLIYHNILKRVEKFTNYQFEDYRVEILGSEDTYGNPRSSAKESREVVAVLNIKHVSKEALEFVANEIAPSALSMCPGMISLLGGRKKPTPIIQMISGTVDREELELSVLIQDKVHNIKDQKSTYTNSLPEKNVWNKHRMIQQDFRCLKLKRLAFARSGDKGSDANIGIIAKDLEKYELLKKRLTPDLIKEYFNFSGQIELYLLPGIGGINILLYGILDGGGLSSLKVDSQGKGLASQILEMEIPLDEQDEK